MYLLEEVGFYPHKSDSIRILHISVVVSFNLSVKIFSIWIIWLKTKTFETLSNIFKQGLIYDRHWQITGIQDQITSLPVGLVWWLLPGWSTETSNQMAVIKVGGTKRTAKLLIFRIGKVHFLGGPNILNHSQLAPATTLDRGCFFSTKQGCSTTPWERGNCSSRLMCRNLAVTTYMKSNETWNILQTSKSVSNPGTALNHQQYHAFEK